MRQKSNNFCLQKANNLDRRTTHQRQRQRSWKHGPELSFHTVNLSAKCGTLKIETQSTVHWKEGHIRVERSARARVTSSEAGQPLLVLGRYFKAQASPGQGLSPRYRIFFIFLFLFFSQKVMIIFDDLLGVYGIWTETTQGQMGETKRTESGNTRFCAAYRTSIISISRCWEPGHSQRFFHGTFSLFIIFFVLCSLLVLRR